MFNNPVVVIYYRLLYTSVDSVGPLNELAVRVITNCLPLLLSIHSSFELISMDLPPKLNVRVDSMVNVSLSADQVAI